MSLITGYPRGVSVSIAPGGSAGVPLGPFPGIHINDEIIAVRQVSADGSLTVNTDRTAEASIVDAETIQLSTTDTTGEILIVVHHEIY